MVAASGISGAGDVLEVPVVSRAIRWAEAMAPVSAEQIQQWLMTGAHALLQGLWGSAGPSWSGP